MTFGMIYRNFIITCYAITREIFMKVETKQFQIENIEWSYNESREITGDRNPRPPIKKGIKSIKAICKSCGHSWKSRPYGKGSLLPFIGGVILTCPSCSVEDRIKNADLE